MTNWKLWVKAKPRWKVRLDPADKNGTFSMLVKLGHICLTVSRSWITHELCCPKLSTDLPTDYPEKSYKE
jgi:hypothetical protein